MGLRYGWVSWRLERGLQESIDPLQLGAEGGAVQLANVRHLQHGKWAKRFGLTGLAKTVWAATAGANPAISSGTALIAHRDRVLLSDSQNIWAYSQTENAWHRRRGLPPAIPLERPFLAWPNRVASYDCAYSGGYLVMAWVSHGSELSTVQTCDVWAQVVDVSTGAVVHGPTILESGTINADPTAIRLCAVGQSVIAAWHIAGTPNIHASRIDLSSASIIQTGGWTAPVNLSTECDWTGGAGNFDICPHYSATDRFYVMYRVDGQLYSRLRCVSIYGMTGTLASATSQPQVGTPGPTCYSLAVGPSYVWAAVGSQEPPNNVVYFATMDPTTCALTGGWSTAFTHTQQQEGGVIRRINICERAGVISVDPVACIISYSTDGTGPYFGLGPTTSTTKPVRARWGVFGISGANYCNDPVNGVMLPDVGILSRVFVRSGRYYQYCGFASDTQPMYLLLEVGQIDDLATGKLVSRPQRIGVYSPLLSVTKGFLMENDQGGAQRSVINAFQSSTDVWEAIGPVMSGSARSFQLKRFRADFAHERLNKSKWSFSRLPAIEGGYVDDGRVCCEWGFDAGPEQPRYDTYTTGGSMGAGIYQYCHVYRWSDGAGNIVRSPPSVPLSITVGGSGSASVQLWFRGLGLTMKDRPVADNTSKRTPRVFIETYRTLASQSLFYLETVQDINAMGSDNAPDYPAGGAEVWTYTDKLSDSQLQALGYGRIYTEGNRNAMYGMWSPHGYTRTATRLWAVMPDQETVIYSEYDAGGRLAAFHPTQAVKIPEEVVGLASFNDQVFALGRHNSFRIVGDGITPNGGGQVPYAVQVQGSGCVSANSIVSTDKGIYFRANDDQIVLLGGEMSSPGEQVRLTLAANPYTNDAVFWRDQNEIRWSLSPSASSTTGVELVYHTLRDTWSVNTYYDADTQTSGRAIKSYAIWKDPTWRENQSLLVMMSSGKVYKVDTQTFLDDGRWAEFSLTMPWMHGDTTQQLGRVGRIVANVKYLTRCNLILEAGYDYGDTFETVGIWTASQNDAVFGVGSWEATIQRLEANASRRMDSFRLRFRDAQPDAGLIGTGEGLHLSELAMELGWESEAGRNMRPGMRR